MAAQPFQLPPQQPQVTFVDRPEVVEIFADSTPMFNFDSNTFRVTFGVTRAVDIVPGKQMTMKQYPSARIVMPAAAGIEFAGKLQQLIDTMIKQGVIKPIAAEMQQPFGTTKPN